MKKVRLFAAVLLWMALLAPFFLAAPAAHPATDDFTFAVYTHPTWVQTGSLLHVLKDALSYALRTWRDWQGTITGVLVMTLNPAVFSLAHYGVHAVVLLALHLAAWLAFIRHMLGHRLGLPRSVWLPLYGVLSALSLLFLPDIVEGIYWFNGAWFYTGAQAIALLTLVLCDRLSERRTFGAAGIAHAVLACGLLFALGMDNYITAMMTLAALFMMALARLWAAHRTPAVGMIAVLGNDGASLQRNFGGPEEKRAQKQAALRTALLMLPLLLGLLLSVIAPGNSVRMARDGAHQAGMTWLLSSVVWTLRDAALYIVRFLVRTPLLALLVAATPLLAQATDRMEDVRWPCPPIPATLFGFYLILCAMIIPHMYSSGYAGSGRVVNMYHFYVLLAAPLAYILILLRLKAARRAALCSAHTAKRCYLLGAAAFVLCLLLGQMNGYAKLVTDQLDGTQAAYIAQFQNEYALCEAAAPEDTVELPAWTVQTMTGKPTAYEDETVWTNESMASYFGVKAVKVVP